MHRGIKAACQHHHLVPNDRHPFPSLLELRSDDDEGSHLAPRQSRQTDIPQPPPSSPVLNVDDKDAAQEKGNRRRRRPIQETGRRATFRRQETARLVGLRWMQSCTGKVRRCSSSVSDLSVSEPYVLVHARFKEEGCPDGISESR